MSAPGAPVLDSEGHPVLYRHPDELTAEEQAGWVRSRVVDVDAYATWLETGEGPEPCGESSG